MKAPFYQIQMLFENRVTRRNFLTLAKIFLFLAGLILVYSTAFHLLMLYEGRNYSWITGIYWSLTVMSTLGFGDITFGTDLGLLFTLIVLLSGIFFMLIILPFTFIQFFYAPWLELQEKRRTPSSLPEQTVGHVIIAGLDPVTEKLVGQLQKRKIPYVILAKDLATAVELRDMGYRVVVGQVDDPETYRNVRVETAALVVATTDDLINTNISFTVREITETVPIVTNAENENSVDILQFPGNTHVFQFMKMLGKAFGEHALGATKNISVIAAYDDLRIGVASAMRTALAGKRLFESGLRENTGITVVGIWEKGRLLLPTPDMMLHDLTVLLLAGTEAQFSDFAQRYSLVNQDFAEDEPVLILGGGRVGQAAAMSLAENNIPYRIVEKRSSLAKTGDNVIEGDAADREVLKQAGIEKARSVIITTHDDDMNIYLTFYCRQLRKDVQIISRATMERNVSKLHRGGADLVMSYSSLGVGAIMNILLPGEISMYTDGLVVFNVAVPAGVRGKSILESRIRELTGCSIVALRRNEELLVGPGPGFILPADGEIILVGSTEAEKQFIAFAEM